MKIMIIKWDSKGGMGANKRVYRIDENDGYWAELEDKYEIHNLGWSPTLRIAKKRCQDLEDYYSKKDRRN
jgi:hypothetical protein